MNAVTLASVWQSSIGNVATGTAFAVLESAGMGGYGLAVVNGYVQAGGIVTVVLDQGRYFLNGTLW
jgi:hypothetical protein